MKFENIINQNKLYIILLLLILLFSFYLRVFALGEAPFWIDESISSIASKNILEKGLPIFDSGLFYGRSLVFHYSQSVSMLLFGINDFGARFPSVIFGLLTIILAFLFGREFFSESSEKNYYALIPALVFGLFFLEVFFSRQARFYQLFQLAFFATIYLMYKSKDNNNFAYLSVLSFVIALDTQLAGIILAPFVFFNLFLRNYKISIAKLSNKKNLVAGVIVALVSLYYLSGVFGVSAGSTELATSYATNYLEFFTNMNFVLILGLVGLVWAFLKYKEKTLFLAIPSAILFVLVIFVELFAFRYIYPATFVILFFFSILLAFLIQKYGKLFVFVLMLVILLPSNLFFPLNYVNVITPISGAFNDFSAPIIDMQDVPTALKQEMNDSTVVSLFPATLEWYITKPDFVIPYSMNGRTPKISEKEVYSGVSFINRPPQKPYFFVKDFFSASKSHDQNQFVEFEENCEKKYFNNSVEVYYCSEK